jgi:hypothetical protein
MIQRSLVTSMACKEICTLSLLSIMIMLILPAVSASSGSLSDLKSVVSGFDDPRMDAGDLAFYLASHGFDATPKGDIVEVNLSGHICNLAPNGSAPGLASITA